MTRLVVAIVCCTMPLIALSDPAIPDQGLRLSFGVYQSDKATEMYRMFNPIVGALEEALAGELGRSVSIELKILKTYEQGQAALVAGDVDFVRFGPVSYILAKDRNPGISLLVMENKKGKKVFTGVIITSQDSSVEALDDLAGKTFAFGNKNSTIGRYLAQKELVSAGIHSDQLSDFEYLDRHDMVAKAVLVGDFDAGALKESTYRKANAGDGLRVIAEFDNVTKPWVARRGMDSHVKNALTKALLNLTDKSILKGLKVDGFFPTDDSEYNAIRNGMQAADEFSRPAAKNGVS